MLVDLSAATLGAPQSALDMDAAELLVACTVLVGPDRALGRAVEAGWGEAIGRVPAVPAAGCAHAASPRPRAVARARSRRASQGSGAKPPGEEAPELVPMRRMRPRDLALTAMVAVAAYLLITQLAKIGFGTIADELRHAEVAWIIVGLLTAQLTFVPGGMSFRGAVPTPLPCSPASCCNRRSSSSTSPCRARRAASASTSASCNGLVHRRPRPSPPAPSTTSRKRSSRSRSFCSRSRSSTSRSKPAT